MSHIISTPRIENHTAGLHSRRWSDRSVASTLREIALMAAMFILYRQVRHLTSGDLDQAMSNANGVVGFERKFGAFTEGSLQRLVLHSRFTIEFLDHYYVFVHFTASFGFMAWVFLRHPEAWGRIRAWFLSVTLAGLVIHVLFPLAPPRMLDQHGFVDTLHVYGPSIYSKDVTNSAANQLAAMPSLHFAWAVIVAAGFISIHRSKLTWLVVLHPIVTLLAIVATANHYWLDASVGGILVAAAVSISYLVKRPLPSFARMPAAAQAPAFARRASTQPASIRSAFTRPASMRPGSTGPQTVGSSARVPVFAQPPALDRVRIARVSTITATPVLARPAPYGRRHDLTPHRAVASRHAHEVASRHAHEVASRHAHEVASRRSPTSRSSDRCPPQGLGDLTKARSFCGLAQTSEPTAA